MPDAAARPRRTAPPLLVFVHIPKTAGTAVRSILDINEPGGRTRPIPNVFKGGGGLNTELIERLRNGRGPLDRAPRDLKTVRILRGHAHLGIREYLPKYLTPRRETRYFSFLREPVDRLLSHYFQIREAQVDSSEQARYALAPLAEDATIDDMLAGGYIHDNLHTRMLCGDPEPFGEVTEEMLEQAKQNLSEGLVFFGLTERFDESVVLAKQRLGLTSILYETNDASTRVNATRPRSEQVPRDLSRAAERANRYDIELYRHAEELFDSAPERQELEFEVELAALRAGNAEGEIEVDSPVAKGFSGSEDEWRMLVHARATVLRLERHTARNRVRATIQRPKGWQTELKAARAKAKRLEGQVEQLKAAAEGSDEQESNGVARERPKRSSKRDRAKGTRTGPKRERRRAAAGSGRAEQTPEEPHEEARGDGG